MSGRNGRATTVRALLESDVERKLRGSASSFMFRVAGQCAPTFSSNAALRILSEAPRRSRNGVSHVHHRSSAFSPAPEPACCPCPTLTISRLQIISQSVPGRTLRLCPANVFSPIFPSRKIAGTEGQRRVISGLISDGHYHPYRAHPLAGTLSRHHPLLTNLDCLTTHRSCDPLPITGNNKEEKNMTVAVTMPVKEYRC